MNPTAFFVFAPRAEGATVPGAGARGQDWNRDLARDRERNAVSPPAPGPARRVERPDGPRRPDAMPGASPPAAPDETSGWIAAARSDDAAGDRAFTRLVSRYRGRVLSLVAGLLGDADQAEDVAQLAFLKARASLGSFRQDARFEAWLCRIAYRTAIDQTRRFWWRRRVSLEGMTEPAREAALGRERGAGEASDPESALIRSERARLVRRALREIPQAYRGPVVLKDLAGLSYEEIGRVLECPIGTVESRIHRGRQALRKKLERMLP